MGLDWYSSKCGYLELVFNLLQKYFHYYCDLFLYKRSQVSNRTPFYFFNLFGTNKWQAHCFLPENAYETLKQPLNLIPNHTEVRADTQTVWCKTSGQFHEVKWYLWRSLNDWELMFYKSCDFGEISIWK